MVEAGAVVLPARVLIGAFVKFRGSPRGEEWLQDNSAWPQMACSFQLHLSEPHLHLFSSKTMDFHGLKLPRVFVILVSI